MQYTKQSKTIEEQADLLIKRGLICNSKNDLVDTLRDISYYRLSYFLYPYRKNDGTDDFKENVSLAQIIDRYSFDRQLRLFMMDLIERIEISVRTSLINEHTQKYGPFGYTTNESFPNMQPEKYSKFIDEVIENKMKSKEFFVLHFNQKYSEEVNLPFWIVCELMNFGSVLTVYKGLEYKMQNVLAKRYMLDKEVLRPFLHSLLYIRNLCAHHQPLINRILQIKPSIPNETVWQVPVYINNDRIFGILSLINFISKQIFNSIQIKQAVCDLVYSSSYINLKDIGFPENWQESKIWE